MIRIELVTIAFLPTFQKATLRLSERRIEGRYEQDRWVFEIIDAPVGKGLKFRFILTPQVAESREFEISGKGGATHTYHASEFEPWWWTRLGPIAELGQAHTRQFDVPRPVSSEKAYDVIVIGSGMAGGVLADRLSDNGIDTLLLEAGGTPLETHIANLPRPHRTGFQKHVWARWFDFRAKNYDFDEGDINRPHDQKTNHYTDGFQAFNLGGRSVFWGGFIPRMTSWELDFWPEQLKWDLEDRYYQIAEELMGLSTAPKTDYSRGFHRLLRELLPDYTHFDAPVAVRTNAAGANTISTGMFSTADLLLESFRTTGPEGNELLTIRTHQQAIKVDAGEPCRVTSTDILTGKQNIFKGKYVVLSCGCLESARLAARSGLGNEYVGKGITDHPIAWTHFEIPPYKVKALQGDPNFEVTTVPFYDRYGAVKTVSQAIRPKEKQPLFNVLIELGADFNQGRFVDPDIFQKSVSKGKMLCEIVFLTNTELVQDNHIDFDTENEYRPIAKIRNPGLSDDLRLQLTEIRDKVLEALDGTVINEGWGDGSLGFVAHEVGSLRMEVKSSNNIKKSSKESGEVLQKELEGVVDLNGKFLNQQHIYACDLSIFPTSPSANPSLTAVALAIRLGDHLKKLLKS